MSLTSTALLAFASTGLMLGPLIGLIGARLRSLHALVDGISLILVGGLCFVFVLPHVVGTLGVLGGGLVLAGAAAPSLAGRILHGRSWSFAVVALALVLHVLLDGAVLALVGHDSTLPWAIVVHRLPVGFALVFAARSSGKEAAFAVVVALIMMLVTIGGFLTGPSIVGWLPPSAPHAIEAVVAGVLLHVLFGSRAHKQHGGCTHEHHEHHEHHELANTSKRANVWAALGALSAGATIAVGTLIAGTEALEDDVLVFLRTLTILVVESAPALLLGYALAGFLPFLLTRSRMTSLKRGGRLLQSLRGVVFGLPLPVCSCGVLPLYTSLVRRGAPLAAAMAFFVATPELGLDAVLLSMPLLGTSLTVARIASAFAVALLVGILMSKIATSTNDAPEAVPIAPTPQKWTQRVESGLRFGFVEVFDHTMPWVGLGLLLAALAEPMFSHEVIGAIPQALQVPIAAIIGVPLYVCASGATPIAALALHKGLSAGAVIAFLIAGPATNMTTFGVLARLHGKRLALYFGLTVTGLAIIAGWVVDMLQIQVSGVAIEQNQVDGSWFSWLCVIALGAFCIASLFRQGPRGVLRQVFEPIHAH